MLPPETRPQPLNSSLIGRIDTLARALALLWGGLIALSLWRCLRDNNRSAEDYARAAAQAAYEGDTLYRRWVSQAGGIYVSVPKTSPSQPSAASTSGNAGGAGTGEPLTSVSPIGLTRLVHEFGQSPALSRGHLASAKPLRPENAADAWEAAALRTFEHGATEATEIVPGAQPVLRLMKPFVVEASCLPCHASQGYRIGDIRSGITTSVALAPYYATARRAGQRDLVSHAILALLGFAVIGFGRRRLGAAFLARDKAYAALAENERRQRQLVERLPLVAVTYTRDGTITYANPALLALAGRTLAEVLGRDLFELFVPRAERPAAAEALRRFCSSLATTANTVGTVADREGRPRTIAWLHMLITDAAGAPVGVTSLGEDITVRNAEELRLRLLSCAVEQSPAAVVITDAEGTIEYVNARFTEITGYTAAEAIGQNPRLLASGKTPPAFYREMWETILAGREWHGVFHNRRKNGDPFWENARISPIRGDAGTIIRFVAIKEDITARRQAEQALAESEQRFRTLVENAPVPVIVSHENRCLYANASARRLFDYPETTPVEGIDIRESIQPESLALVAERQRRILAGLPTPPTELGLRRRDGTQLVCESIATGITYNNRPASLILLVDTTERRLMVSALEESEARYRTLVEVAPVAIFALAHGRFTFANPAAARLFGFDQPGSLLGSSLWQRVHPDSLAFVTELFARAESGQEIPITEIRLLRQDRQTVVCATIAVRLGTGPEPAVLAIARDITEYKHLEDALRESEARMRETLENTAAGYFLLDREDRLLHANSAFLQCFDQPTLAAARGRRFTELLPEPERTELSEYLLRLNCGDEFVGGQLRHRRPDGTAAHFSFTAHLVRQTGELSGSEGFLLDTTAAHASEERYQMLFEQMLDGFALHEIICDEDGRPVDYRFLAVNPAFERLMGRPAAQLVGRRIHEIFPQLDPKWIERYGAVALTGEPLAMVDYSAELDRHFEIAAFRPAPGRFACLVRDVTEKRRLAQQLQQAQKMEAVGQLAGGVAHDYNNILVAILMNLALLRNETSLRPETAESLIELEREAKRAATLTRQLLVFSRRQAVQPLSLDFNEQLEHLLTMLRRLLGEHIVIVTHLAPELPHLFADPGMLDQVVMNLCVNARDAMPAGGRLELSTSRIEFATASAAHPGARAGTFLHFAVRDTGTGMDAATREHIFEPFFTTKESGKGTGLGLATVFGIVQQHGGWIEVESTPGQGSTFRIFLPFAPASVEPPPPPAAPAPVPTRGTETILLVEDDAISRQTIGLTLRRDGYRVLEAQTVAAALAVWAEEKAHIAAVITDVVMPGGRNGLELAQQLHAEHPALSIIIISGYSDDAVKATPVVAGATYLAKPFDYETLTQTLRTSLARRPS